MTERQTTRGLDPELQAMAKIDRILAEFDEEEQSRIMIWLNGRYDIIITEAAKPCPTTPTIKAS